MSWLVWLLIPVAATLLVACWTWVRARPKSTPTTKQAMRAHQQYLDALDPSAREVTVPRGDLGTD